MKTIAYKAKSTHPRTPLSKRRARTEKTAMQTLADAGIPAARCRGLAARIQGARQPIAEAQRVINRVALQGLSMSDDGVDFSDVLELRITLCRRDGAVWPPVSDLLTRMNRLIALGELDREGFEALAADALSMPLAWPKAAR